MKKKSFLLSALLLLAGIITTQANARPKGSPGLKLIKGAAKVIISTGISIQISRYLHESSEDIPRDAFWSFFIAYIPNLHYFISGCKDIRHAIKQLKPGSDISVSSIS